MKKITVIGAGSTMFARQLLSALFAYKDLPPTEVVLEDINEQVLERSFRLVGLMIEQAGVPVTLSMTVNQKEALRNADFVINAIQVGGLEPWKLDMEIPQRYGISQEVGDTLGAGGIFRGLRQIPPVLSILRDMEEVCPQALFINYSNPLAPLTWAASQASSIRSIGLCYGVRYTASQLAGYLGVGPWVDHPHTPELWQALMYQDVPEDIEYRFGGINHMTWMLEFRHKGEDLYPLIHQLPDNPAVYKNDAPRCEILKHFGYWSTENHWHMTDYVPYFRKNEAMINKFLPRRWNLLALEQEVHALANEEINRQLAGEQPFRIEENMLNGAKLIHAMLTNTPTRINGNVANQPENGLLIDNLPANCVVEVPIHVDSEGLHPETIGTLPTQCAALNKTNINVQELIVEAALKGDKQAAKYALALDPLTAALCTLEQIDNLFEELLEAQKPWLPQF